MLPLVVTVVLCWISCRIQFAADPSLPQRFCRHAFGDGSVVTWGDVRYGGGSSAVRTRLENVQQIQASQNGAFAAMLGNASVVTRAMLVLG